MLRDRSHLCDISNSSSSNMNNILSKHDRNRLELLKNNHNQSLIKNERYFKENYNNHFSEKKEIKEQYLNQNFESKKDNEDINLKNVEKMRSFSLDADSEINEKHSDNIYYLNNDKHSNSNKITNSFDNKIIDKSDSIENALLKLTTSHHELSLALTQKNKEELLSTVKNSIHNILLISEKRNIEYSAISKIINEILNIEKNQNSIINNDNSAELGLLFQITPGIDNFSQYSQKSNPCLENKKKEYDMVDNIIYLLNKKEKQKTQSISKTKKHKEKNEKMDKNYARNEIKKAKSRLSANLIQNDDDNIQ